MIYFDAVLRASREIKDSELCYCLSREGKLMTYPKPCIVKMKHAQQELESPALTRLNFNYAHQLDDVGSPANLVIELRTFDPLVENSLRSHAWTAIQLYDPAGQLAVGKWRVPFYKTPTKLGIDLSAMERE